MEPKASSENIAITEVSNTEEVRIYRLTVLEENQMKMMHKMDSIEDKLLKFDITKEKNLISHDNRISILEKRANKFDSTIFKFKFLIYAEAIALVGLFIKKVLGL